MPAHLPLSDLGATHYERVMGHAPHILQPWTALEQTFFSNTRLPPALLEQVRRTLAQGHGCEYCQVKAGPPDLTHSELKTSLAVAFAQAYAQDHREISGAQIQMLRTHFTDEELVELTAFIAFMWAGGTFGKILGIQAPPPLPPDT